MTAALEGGEWLAALPGRTLPPGKTRYHFTVGWVGPRASLDGRKISSPPKIKIYRTMITPVVLYGNKTWSLTLGEKRRLRVFENMVLRRTSGTRGTR